MNSIRTTFTEPPKSHSALRCPEYCTVTFVRFCGYCFLTILGITLCGIFINDVMAEERDTIGTQVEINGDIVEYSVDEEKVIASGDVSVIRGDVTLLCDKLEFDRASKTAHATGNVVLIRPEGRMTGNKLTFNFDQMKGDFTTARIYSKPFFAEGDRIEKIDENHMVMHKGRITTCDLDRPHYHFFSGKIDIFPEDKAVGRNVRLMVGKIPLMWIPRFTQDLSDNRPVFTYTPGYNGDWGAFVLSQYRYQLSEDLKGIIHMDYRTKQGFASGVDVKYDTAKYGNGIIRTYYTQERLKDADHFFSDAPLISEKERFRGEWRHRWQVDDKTNAIWQYYRLSDPNFLKDFFEKESDEDVSPDSYFLLTRSLFRSTLSLRSDVRVNRFTSMVERLPELNFNLPNVQIGSSKFYFKNSSIYSNLVKKDAAPSEDRPKTHRVFSDSELSYRMKLGFIEMTPKVGGSGTYYSRTKSQEDYDSVRGQFRTGADLSTKFYRIFDVVTDKWGLDVNRLRHIITPSIAYLYAHDPTQPTELFDDFDSIDSIDRSHSVNLSIENKLQTKRDNKSVDLARVIVNYPYKLKEDPGGEGFGNITSEIDVLPFPWLSFYFDSEYDTTRDRFQDANIDMYIKGDDNKWSLNFGKRYNADVDDQITTEFSYVINPKWKFRTYHRFDVDSGLMKEQQYGITRDMHAWTMELNLNETRDDDSEVWIVFRLKEFPDIGFDAGTSFNRRRESNN